MPDPEKDLYKPGPLDRFSFKERLTIRIAEVVFYLATRLIGATLKFERIGWQHFQAIEDAGRIPIYTFWHDRIFAGTYFFRDRGIVVMSSYSKDAQYVARCIWRLGYGVIRGSSSRGGSRALVQMIKGMKRGTPMGFTADGPKGPKYIAKPGSVFLAKKTGNPIMPFVVEPRHYWTVRSWDRTQIPRPFSSVAVIIGEPIYVGADGGDAATANKLQELQSSLDDLVVRGETWRRAGENSRR